MLVKKFSKKIFFTYQQLQQAHDVYNKSNLHQWVLFSHGFYLPTQHNSDKQQLREEDQLN